MEFRILGPLEVAVGSRTIAIAGGRQRELLGLLLLHRNDVVSADRLLEGLWGEAASAASVNALQAAVSRLRRALPEERLQTKPPGYLLRLARDELDADRFERLLAAGRTALSEGGTEAAGELLRQALSLWRGSALSDFLYEPFAQTEIARLEELRLDGLEERIEADLSLGRHAELVPELEALVADQPLRERPRGQLMLALYRAGRQAEALKVYRVTRTMLLEELGLEPGPALRDLERRMLAQDAILELRLPPRPAPLRVAPRATRVPQKRKIVTVLCCDLADSTGRADMLDPEVLRELLGRFAIAASETMAAHGGIMETAMGDVVTAVFGIPTLHEDDALRAIRAAVDLRARVGEVNRDFDARLQARIGIETGEVVAGDAHSGGVLATGAAVAMAARLQQQASPGDILLGEATRRLAAATVLVEPRGHLTPKGKRESLAAWRLLGLVPEPPPFAWRLEIPLIGREVELAQLRQSLARAARDRGPHLFTILGPAGIGKTRLAREFAATAEEETPIVVGRCLSYGEGITFWPLREIVLQAPEGELRTRLSALLGDGEGGAVTAAAAAEEIFLAARRLLEALAGEGPLVVVLEDLHWAEPLFLDFVEYVAERARDCPMLLLCLARGELLELRPTWGAGMENASSIRLEPLADEETALLLDALHAPSGTRARVKDAAEGNPLFVEQMLAWLEEVGDADHDRQLPPTIQAVLAARLDRLGPGQTAVVHRAAVIGRDFEPGAVVELLPVEARRSALRHLDALVRKGLLRPLQSEPDERTRFRFAHALVQDAAYRMVPKRLRAKLHEDVAGWLEQSEIPHKAILGYHLEQAYRYRAELGPVRDAERELAARAANTLAHAGLDAHHHGDHSGAANLLSRGLKLLPADAPSRGDFLVLLTDSLLNAGDWRAAAAVSEDALAAAETLGDRSLAWEARLLRGVLELSPGTRSFEECLREAEQAAAELEGRGHERAVARAWTLIAYNRLQLGLAAAAAAAERAAALAQRARDWHLERASLGWLGLSLHHGPTPASEGVRRCAEIRAHADDGNVRRMMCDLLSSFHAMLGHTDEARRLYELALADAEDRGLRRSIAIIEEPRARSFAQTLEPAEAEARLRRSLAYWQETGSLGSSTAAKLAHVLCAQGRYDEAERYAAIGESAAVIDDYESQSLVRAARARVLAHRGEVERAESLAREAVEIADRTDDIDTRGWLRTDLAEVLTRAGKAGDARSVLEEAVRLAEEKEDIVLVERARAGLAELQASTLPN